MVFAGADGSLAELHNPTCLTPNFMATSSRELRRTSYNSDDKAFAGDPLGVSANGGELHRYATDPTLAASAARVDAQMDTPSLAPRRNRVGKTFTLDSRQSDDSFGTSSPSTPGRSSAPEDDMTEDDCHGNQHDKARLLG